MKFFSVAANHPWTEFFNCCRCQDEAVFPAPALLWLTEGNESLPLFSISNLLNKSNEIQEWIDLFNTHSQTPFNLLSLLLNPEKE